MAKSRKSKAKAKPKKTVGPMYFGTGAVRYSFLEGEPASMALEIDWGKAPVPPRSYYSNMVALQKDDRHAVAILSFGRVAFDGDVVSQQIDIVISQVALFQTYWDSSRDLESTVESALSRLNLKPLEPMTSFSPVAESTYYANILYSAVSGSEVTLDFYFVSPRDVHRAIKFHGDVSIVPVVRIIASMALLKQFLDLCRPHTGDESIAVGSQKEHANESIS